MVYRAKQLVVIGAMAAEMVERESESPRKLCHRCAGPPSKALEQVHIALKRPDYGASRKSAELIEAVN